MSNATLFGTLEALAIERMKAHEPSALRKSVNGFQLAYSGGKDSDVLLHLARKANIKHIAIHNLTTCDPPELVRHVRTKGVEIGKPVMTMWQLIRKKKMPPRRNARYCCEVMKERGGDGHIVLTGVRWGESARRSKRRMMEACYRAKNKWYLHPIIDWSTSDVWDYIRSEGIEYCKLYDEGHKRLGCVLCPMVRNVEAQLLRWPKLCAAWEKAIKATYVPGKGPFKSAEAYWQWWLDRDAPSPKDEPMLFDSED